MHYYHIFQSRETVNNTPNIENIFYILQRRNVTLENAWRIPYSISTYLLDSGSWSFKPGDFLDRSLILISPALSKLIKKYEQEMLTRNFIMIQKKAGIAHHYVLPIFRELDCLDISQSKFLSNPENNQIKWKAGYKTSLRVFKAKAKIGAFPVDVIVIDEKVAEEINACNFKYIGMKQIYMHEME